MYLWHHNNKIKGMRYSLFIISIAMTAFSCSPYSDIKKYYQDNTSLHQALADSLHNFTTQHKTEIILRRSLMEDRTVTLNYDLPGMALRAGIKYDSLLN